MWRTLFVSRRSPSKTAVRWHKKSAVRPKRRLESLEERSVMTATFGSALDIPSDDLNSSLTAAVEADAAGNSYVAGRFGGTVDFDHGPGEAVLTARGSQDVFVAKYTPDNSLVWVKQFGGDETAGWAETARGLALTDSGDIYVSGLFRGVAQFGSSTLTSAGNEDAFLAKLNVAGNVIWARSWGNSQSDFGYAVDVDSAGNAYALSTANSITIKKFTPTGNVAWTKSIANNPLFAGNQTADIDVDAAGNSFIAGHFDNTVDFDPGPKTKYVTAGPSSTSTVGSAGFVLKLDTGGNYKWVTPFIGMASTPDAGWAIGYQIQADAQGNVYTAGSFAGPVDFNPSSQVTTLGTDRGIYVAKLNGSGGLLWTRTAVNQIDALSASVFDLAVDATGSVYAVGNMSGGSADFDPGAGQHILGTAGTSSAYITKLTSTGTLSWAAAVDKAVALAAAVDAEDTLHVGGYFTGVADFDLDPLARYNLTSGTKSRGFLARWRQM